MHTSIIIETYFQLMIFTRAVNPVSRSLTLHHDLIVYMTTTNEQINCFHGEELQWLALSRHSKMVAENLHFLHVSGFYKSLQIK